MFLFDLSFFQWCGISMIASAKIFKKNNPVSCDNHLLMTKHSGIQLSLIYWASAHKLNTCNERSLTNLKSLKYPSIHCLDKCMYTCGFYLYSFPSSSNKISQVFFLLNFPWFSFLRFLSNKKIYSVLIIHYKFLQNCMCVMFKIFRICKI